LNTNRIVGLVLFRLSFFGCSVLGLFVSVSLCFGPPKLADVCMHYVYATYAAIPEKYATLFNPDFSYHPRRAKVLECSAKEDSNVTDLFKSLLSLSRFLPASSSGSGGSGTAGEAAPSGFKRRSSAYVSASSSRSK